jgi:hypothetical protein
MNPTLIREFIQVVIDYFEMAAVGRGTTRC